MRGVSAALAVILGFLFSGCDSDSSEFERIAMPVRFAQLRDTARWVPEFDPLWWTPIDEAYAEYDREIERIVAERWEPFLNELSTAPRSAGTLAADEVGTLRARGRSIDVALAAAEKAFIARLEDSLPPEASRFIELFAARVECARATAVWTDRGRPLPLPLEELSRVGVTTGDDAILASAVVVYRDVAREARRRSEERAKEYVAWVEDLAALDRARTALVQASSNGGGKQVERASKDIERRRNELRASRADATESLRVQLLKSGDGFAGAIADDSVRSEFVERLEADLHEGMSTTRTMEMYARLAERVLTRAHPDDSARLEEFRADVARGLELQRTRRVLLRSPDPAERKAAYQELARMPAQIIESAAKKLDRRLSRRLFLQAVRVDLGQIDEEGAVAAVFGRDLPQVADTQRADATDVMTKAAKGAERLTFLGSALSPRVLATLAEALGLADEAKVEFDALVEAETARVATLTEAEAERISAALDGLGKDESIRSDDRRLRESIDGAMRAVRAGMASMLSRNREANARILDAAMRLAGQSEDDPAIVEARIELELLAHVGSRGLGQSAGRQELERMAGVTVECYSNPFTVARLMDVTEGEREAAIALIGSRGDELVAAAREVRERMVANLGGFLRRMIVEDRSVFDGERGARPPLASANAVKLRFELVDELEAVLGRAVADAYEESWRGIEQSPLEPPRSSQFERLEARVHRGVDDVLLDASLRAAIAGAQENRRAASRAAHRWRASNVVMGSLRTDDDWRMANFSEPLGALLYSRIADADDRGVAACEAIVALVGARAGFADAFENRERPIVRTLRPR